MADNMTLDAFRSINVCCFEVSVEMWLSDKIEVKYSIILLLLFCIQGHHFWSLTLKESFSLSFSRRFLFSLCIYWRFFASWRPTKSPKDRRKWQLSDFQHGKCQIWAPESLVHFYHQRSEPSVTDSVSLQTIKHCPLLLYTATPQSDCFYLSYYNSSFD